MFTIWAKQRDGRVYYEPQARISDKDGLKAKGGFILMPKGGLYHSCGGALKLIPDYFKAEF